MPQPNRIAQRRAPAAALWPVTPLLLAGASLSWLSAGMTCLWVRAGDAAPGPVLAPAGLTLVACAVVQFRCMLAGRRLGRLKRDQNPLVRFGFWRSLSVGGVLLYLATLALGEARHVGCAWVAGVCAWQTLLMLPLAAAPETLETWRNWTQRYAARGLAWLVYAAILILLVAEGGLRVRRAARDSMGLSAVATTLQNADVLAGPAGPVATLAGPAARLDRARFRVAMLGDRPVCDCESDGCPARIEAGVPGVQIVPLASSLTWPGAAAGEVAAEVQRSDPDLVLAVLSVCDEVSREPPRRGYFDWRQFELARLLVGRSPEAPRRRGPVAGRDFESFLRRLGPQLAACRTPIDGTMDIRWEGVFASLDQLIAGCREAGVPAALVVVPAEFQVNPRLCETLLRRHGLSADRFDVGLPQRRLAGFAQQRRLPLIDLLPHFRLCRQPVYRRNTAALNDEGHSAAASAIGGWLQSRYGGQLAAQLSAAP